MEHENEVTSIEKVLQAMNIAPQRIAVVMTALQTKGAPVRQEPVEEPLLTPKQLCERLGVSSTTLWRNGDVPYLTVGARRRYLWSEVTQFLARQKTGAA